MKMYQQSFSSSSFFELQSVSFSKDLLPLCLKAHSLHPDPDRYGSYAIDESHARLYSAHNLVQADFRPNQILHHHHHERLLHLHLYFHHHRLHHLHHHHHHHHFQNLYHQRYPISFDQIYLPSSSLTSVPRCQIDYHHDAICR
ncbi:hypothetical protein HanRHA438_Chr04g0189721 [Helianthus annuus]|nr:hypothetical protein HanRHA438_Chr04g0189721 [Helianthus annuus]